MMKAAEQIAYQNHALALITGDSVGQVASQTATPLPEEAAGNPPNVLIIFEKT